MFLSSPTSSHPSFHTFHSDSYHHPSSFLSIFIIIAFILLTIGSSLCFDLVLPIIEVEFFPPSLYHPYLLSLFQFISLFFEFISTFFFCSYLQIMSFSLFFGLNAFLSVLSCFFCSYILVETKDQICENILIAIQRNLSHWFGSCLFFRNSKRHHPQSIQLQHHQYLELNDETSHSIEDIPSPPPLSSSTPVLSQT